MPNLTFVLPHWLYWSGLVLFPLVAMYLVRRAEAAPPGRGVNAPIAYLLLVTGGFVGLHRFYLRSRWGLAYVPVFAAMLYCNGQTRALRNAVSKARHDVMGAEFLIERAEKALADGAAGAADRLAAAKAELAAAQDAFARLSATLDQWDLAALALLIAIGLGLLFDAFRIPKLLRSAAAEEEREEHPEPVPVPPLEFAPAPAPEAYAEPARGGAVVRAIDGLSRFSGHFVCYWSVIAVFVYYYEVLARYVFNSPTNWAHESMFLMFGMQYLIAGAYAYREEAHVRVDVLYSMLGRRARALLDILTSVFFFIFSGALLWTGWTFMMDAIAVWEVSFTEWAIQYWPVKASMVVGAVLIVLQGIAKLAADIAVLRGRAG